MRATLRGVGVHLVTLCLLLGLLPGVGGLAQVAEASKPVSSGWVPLEVPPELSKLDTPPPNHVIFIPSTVTGDLFVAHVNGYTANCSYTTTVWYADKATHTWHNITGKGLPSQSCNRAFGFIGLPNGSTLLSFGLLSSSKLPINAVLYGWNLSLPKPVWTRISGGPGQGSNPAAQNLVYSTGAFNRADGITCFTIDHIYCNSSPNSLSFSVKTRSGMGPDGKIGKGLYYGTGKGAAGNTGNGFVYALADFDAGDGRGEQAWGCGEGDALQFSPYHMDTLYKDFVDFVPYNAQGTEWKGNCLEIAHGPTSVMIVRDAANSSPYPPGTAVAHIALPSMKVTIIPPANGYAAYPGTGIGTFHYVSGSGTATKWIWSTRKDRGRIYNYSPDDGASWIDLASSLLEADPGCTRSSISVVETDGKSLYTLCKNATTELLDYWQYTP